MIHAQLHKYSRPAVSSAYYWQKKKVRMLCISQSKQGKDPPPPFVRFSETPGHAWAPETPRKPRGVGAQSTGKKINIKTFLLILLSRGGRKREDIQSATKPYASQRFPRQMRISAEFRHNVFNASICVARWQRYLEIEATMLPKLREI